MISNQTMGQDQLTAAQPRRPAAARPWCEPAYRLGFWAASLTAIFSAAYVVSLFVQPLFPEWRGAAASAATFSPLQQLSLYPSLLLAPTFLVLLAAIHSSAPAEQRVWSLSALALGVLYATMASINYNIQLVSVKHSLLNGEIEELAMFLMANPHSVVPALANSYVYMALAMLLAAFVFKEGRLERWIRALLLVAGLAAPLQLAWSLFDLNVIVVALSLVPWTLGAVGASILLAVLFWRLGSAVRSIAAQGEQAEEGHSIS